MLLVIICDLLGHTAQSPLGCTTKCNESERGVNAKEDVMKNCHIYMVPGQGCWEMNG